MVTEAAVAVVVKIIDIMKTTDVEAVGSAHSWSGYLMEYFYT